MQSSRRWRSFSTTKRSPKTRSIAYSLFLKIIRLTSHNSPDAFANISRRSKAAKCAFFHNAIIRGYGSPRWYLLFRPRITPQRFQSIASFRPGSLKRVRRSWKRKRLLCKLRLTRRITSLMLCGSSWRVNKYTGPMWCSRFRNVLSDCAMPRLRYPKRRHAVRL